jgi:Zn-dependent peptidase ImmA (M78 family)/transcriptional regulator with XRE-family HTH domain
MNILVTNKFNGNMLREARQARGLKASQLANELAITRQAVSSYENNKKQPSSEIVHKICDVLNIPQNFLFQSSQIENDDFSLSPIFYRSFSSAPISSRDIAKTKAKWTRRIFHFLNKYVEFPEVNVPYSLSPPSPLELNNDLIEEIAEKVRDYWNIGLGPISNIVWLAENNGIVISKCFLNTKKLDGLSFWDAERPYILLAQDKLSPSRSRFDVAHEIGHLILHKNLDKSLIKSAEKDFEKLIENQANRFAAAFLFPKKMYIGEIGDRTMLEKFRLKKPRWKVSIGMMMYRAKDLGLISDTKYKSLCQQYSRKGWQKKEPLEERIEIEEPKLMSGSMRLLIEKNVISRSEILESLCLERSDIEDLSCLSENFLNPKITSLQFVRDSTRKPDFHRNPGQAFSSKVLPWPKS